MSGIQSEKDQKPHSEDCLISDISLQESEILDIGKENMETVELNVSSVYRRMIKRYFRNFEILHI